jgi:DNA uptake protein ComE-like DNA-binding protein
MRNYFYILVLILVILPSAVSVAMVNINTADAVQLDTLPGIGPSNGSGNH